MRNYCLYFFVTFFEVLYLEDLAAYLVSTDCEVKKCMVVKHVQEICKSLQVYGIRIFLIFEINFIIKRNTIKTIM